MDAMTGALPSEASTTGPHLRLVHGLRHRVRIFSPVVHKDAERAYILEILLRKHAAIRRVRATPDIGTVTVHFDPRALPATNLLTLLGAVLRNIARRPAPGVPEQPTAGAPSSSCATGYCPTAPATETTETTEITAAVEGMTCAACALLIEMTLNRDPRVQEARVNFGAETVVVRGSLDKEAVFARIRALGYRARPMDTLAQRRLVATAERQRVVMARRRLIWAAVLTLPVMAIGMAMPRSRGWHLVELTLTTPVVVWAGRPFFQKAWRLARQGAANMDSLIALGAGAAYLYSLAALFGRRHLLYFEAAAGIIGFVLLGRYLEERAKGRAGEAIRSLIALQPTTATLMTEAGERVVPAEALQVGDRFLVRPGERIATDGIVVDGVANVDESMVTGESMPVRRGPGERVIGGCLNGAGALTVRATAVGTDTVLAGIVRMVDHAQATKLPVQKMADRISAVFVPGVMAVAAVAFIGWLIAGTRFATALSHAMAVLLIACPCSLGLATPTAIMVATGRAARQGIYIRNGEALETAGRLQVIVFDKTGTITEGRPRVTALVNGSDLSDATLLALAAAAEGRSEHFLARAIRARAEALSVPRWAATDFAVFPGRGIRARVQGREVLLGNGTMLTSHGIDALALDRQVAALAEAGETPVLMAVDGKPMAVIGIADGPRRGAPAAVARLRRLGIAPIMVTGDTAATARTVAALVGIRAVIAQAAPERKLAIVRELQRMDGMHVGMVGDGINDAPALAAADVSFAVGTGTDVAMDTADMTLVSGDIAQVVEAIVLSRRTMRIIRQNLVWALGYNTIAIPLAAMGRLSPMIASAAMALSSVSVVTNSLRLNR